MREIGQEEEKLDTTRKGWIRGGKAGQEERLDKKTRDKINLTRI